MNLIPHSYWTLPKRNHGLVGKFHIIGTGWSPSVAAGPVRASHVCSDWCTVRRLDGWMRSLDVKLYILFFLQHVGCSNSLGVYGIWPGFCMFLTLCDFTGIMVRRENLFNNQSPFCFITVNIIKPNRQMANKAQDKRWWVFEYIYMWLYVCLCVYMCNYSHISEVTRTWQEKLFSGKASLDLIGPLNWTCWSRWASDLVLRMDFGVHEW